MSVLSKKISGHCGDQLGRFEASDDVDIKPVGCQIEMSVITVTRKY